MNATYLLEHQLDFLKDVNIRDSEDLLLAMPAVATVKKMGPSKVKKYITAFNKLSSKKIQNYIDEEIAYFSNDILFNEDALEVTWLFQQFAFFLEEFSITLSLSNETRYEKIIDVIWGVPWQPQELETIFSWVHESGIESTAFLPCLRYAYTATKTYKSANTTTVSLKRGFNKQRLGLAAHSDEIPLNIANKFDFKDTFEAQYLGKKNTTKIEAHLTQKQVYVIQIESAVLPSALAFKDQCVPFERLDQNTAKAELPVSIFDLANKKALFTLHYIGLHKVILEIN